ncbi:MAG: SRPBCC domain-containing protein [Candidatus Acidiferrum sp.]
MGPNIQQSVRFRTSPQTLYDLYLDSKKHSRATGAPAKLSGKVGGNFTAFGKKLEGKILFLARGKQIVQVWRASHWKKEDWSILVLNFSKVAGGAQVDLVHIGVPQYDQSGVREGWPKYYWRPWKKYLSKEK